MKPPRCELSGLRIESLPQPGDLWRVCEISLTGQVFVQRVEAEPNQYRKRGDGLWPPLPDTRPVTDEEAKALCDQMDVAMQREGERVRAELEALERRQQMQIADAFARGQDPFRPEGA